MSLTSKNIFDVVVIGGGFYGCMIALHFKRYFKNIVLIEKENDLLIRASYNNQARIHNGYHYPRSFLTAISSHKNYSVFKKDLQKAIVDRYKIIYAIAKNNSKTSTLQFIEFCKQIGSPVYAASDKIIDLFNDSLIDSVFEVEESVFDATLIRKILKEKLTSSKVHVLYDSEVTMVKKENSNEVKVILENNEIISKKVVNTAYSGINCILKNSNLPLVSFKHELVEMPLLKVPEELRELGITIMDGPFFGIMPLPDRNLHTLHHVRYSPQISWIDDGEGIKKHKKFGETIKKSNYNFMINDAQRYIPIAKNSKYKGSLYEIRTVLTQNEENDGRPILYKNNHGIKNFSVVMGGKIDNIYDVLDKIRI